MQQGTILNWQRDGVDDITGLFSSPDSETVSNSKMHRAEISKIKTILRNLLNGYFG